jgi:hypothetical protein
VLYCCDAEDTIGANNHPLTLRQRLEVAKLMEFTVGIKAMVMINITTEADCNPGLTTVLLMCIYRVWWQYN